MINHDWSTRDHSSRIKSFFSFTFNKFSPISFKVVSPWYNVGMATNFHIPKTIFICPRAVTVFWELVSENCEEMSFRVLQLIFLATLELGNNTLIFPGFRYSIFSRLKRLDQSCARENISWIIIKYYWSKCDRIFIKQAQQQNHNNNTNNVFVLNYFSL